MSNDIRFDDEEIRRRLEINDTLNRLEMFQLFKLEEGELKSRAVLRLRQEVIQSNNPSIRFVMTFLGNNFEETKKRFLELSVLEFNELARKSLNATRSLLRISDELLRAACQVSQYCTIRTAPVTDVIKIVAGNIIEQMGGLDANTAVLIAECILQVLDVMCVCGPAAFIEAPFV